MCGSGTLLAEACMHVCHIPACYLRKRFGFERLPDFDPSLWKTVRRKCNRQIRPLPHDLICGSDQDETAVEAAMTNCQTLPGGKSIRVRTQRFQDIKTLDNLVIICNPPYGVRLNTAKQADVLLQEFGVFLKKRCPGSVAYVYLGKEDLLKRIPLWPSWKKPLNNGGLQGYLAKYKIR